MGEWLIDIYKNKIKKEYKIAFIVTFVLALLMHIYLITNNVESGDALYNYYHTQNMTTSGRWALSFFCSFSSYFHLSWFSGFLAIIFISLTTVVFTKIFKIKNPIVIGLMGGLLASSLSVTDTMRYIYTADGYMIAMFLASLSVYFTRIEEKRTTRYILSGIMLCLACGIYQAYIPFALVLVLFEAIELIIEGKYKKKACLKWLKNQAILYVIAIASYYVIWKLCLYFCDIEAHTYLGISEVGKLNIDMIIRGIMHLPMIAKRFFFATPTAVHLSPFVILNIFFLILAFAVVVYLFFKNKIYKQKWQMLIYISSFVLILPFACLWIFTSESLGVWRYWPRMLGGLSLIYIFILVLYEKYCGKVHKNLFLVLIITIVFNNSVLINVLYYSMEQTFNRSYADGLEMTLRIHDVVGEYQSINPETHISEIVFVGTKMNDVMTSIYDRNTLELTKFANSYAYTYDVVETYLYDGIHAYLFVTSNFDVDYEQSWDVNYRDSYLDKEEVIQMDVWPSKNSVAIIDDVIVVKLSNNKEASA